MPFFCSTGKYFEKEQANHNFYDETGMNEICIIYTHMLIRCKCWLDIHRLLTTTALMAVKN